MFGLVLLSLLGIGLLVSVIDDGSDSGPDGEEIEGTEAADTLEGGGGDDLIRALAGNDSVTGGRGDDTIEGGAGDDDLFGEAGDDEIDGGSGYDSISGGGGDDTLTPGEFVPGTRETDEVGDPIESEMEFDVIDAGAGDDLVDGTGGEGFVAFGDEGDDRIIGSTGEDLLFGGDGSDVVRGAQGSDFLMGSGFGLDLEDIDAFEPVEDNAPDTLFGGQGQDVLVLQGGDVGTGGNAADLFVAAEADEDVTPGERITITDFESGRDAIGLFVTEGSDPTASAEEYLDSQTVTEDGVEIELGSGAVLVLAGLDAPIEEGDLFLIEPDELAI